MTLGQQYWQVIQMGREATPGTAVPATTIHRGTGMVEDGLKTVFPDENVGIAMRGDRAYIPELGAMIKFNENPATFEQIMHEFEASLANVGTGVADGVGTGKIYDYPFPTTTPLEITDIKTYTLEGGDNAQCEEAEYAVVEEWELKGSVNEPWKKTSSWFARQLTPTNYTGALSLVAVEEMLFNNTKLFIDTPSSGFGNTQVSNQLLSASIKGKTGWHPRATASGALYFSHAEWTASEMSITAELSFLHDSSMISEKAHWRAKTARLVQLLCEGKPLGTAGTYSKKTMKINLPGKWEKFGALEVDKGASMAKGTFVVRYNSTAASAGGITIVNEVASVP